LEKTLQENQSHTVLIDSLAAMRPERMHSLQLATVGGVKPGGGIALPGQLDPRNKQVDEQLLRTPCFSVGVPVVVSPNFILQSIMDDLDIEQPQQIDDSFTDQISEEYLQDLFGGLEQQGLVVNESGFIVPKNPRDTFDAVEFYSDILSRAINNVHKEL